MSSGKNTLINRMENEGSEYPIVCIFGEIVTEIIEEAGSLIGKCLSSDVTQELDMLDERPNIKGIIIMINSGGGSVMGGINITQKISNMSKPTFVYVTGFACSIAAVISVFGDYRIMNPFAKKMFHNPFFAEGVKNPNQKKFIDETKDMLVRMVASKINKSPKEVLEKLFIDGNDTFLDYGECKSFNLVDSEIKDSAIYEVLFHKMEEVLNFVDVKVLNKQDTIEKPVENKIIDKNIKPNKMSEIINELLGLDPKAGEGLAIKKINELVNKMTAMENKEKELENAKKEMEAKNDAYNKLMDEHTTMKAAQAKADEEAKANKDAEMKNQVTVDCQKLLTDAVNAKQILATNTVFIDGLKAKVEKGELNIVSLKAVIEGLPIITSLGNYGDSNVAETVTEKLENSVNVTKENFPKNAYFNQFKY